MRYRRNGILIALLVGAFALRLGAVRFLGDTDPQTASLWEYGKQARNYIEHGTISLLYLKGMEQEFLAPSSFMPPGLVFLWIGLFTIFGVTSSALATMLLLNALLGTLIVWLVYAIAEAATGRKHVALLAALITCCYPTFVYSVATYHAVNFYIALFLLAVLVTMRYAHTGAMRYGLALGAICGVMALFRANLILHGAFLVLFSFCRRRSLRLVALQILLIVAVLTPWTVRNHRLFGKPIYSANSLGYSLWRGHNPTTKGSGQTDLIPADLWQALRGLEQDDRFEVAKDRLFLREALEHIRENPLGELTLAIRKFFLFWVYEFYDTDITRRLIYLIPHFATLVLFVIGMTCSQRDMVPEPRQLMFGLFVVQTMVMVCFFVLVRYRMLIEPLLFIFAAVGFFRLWAALHPREH
ncbi:MAG: glycosyltransferase family 39 protein [Phycisphaerales bacterium]|nr:MAG: glycosyltransferase family 39 protein [Phycisphaerales bacterium]